MTLVIFAEVLWPVAGEEATKCLHCSIAVKSNHRNNFRRPICTGEVSRFGTSSACPALKRLFASLTWNLSIAASIVESISAKLKHLFDSMEVRRGPKEERTISIFAVFYITKTTSMKTSYSSHQKSCSSSVASLIFLNINLGKNTCALDVWDNNWVG